MVTRIVDKASEGDLFKPSGLYGLDDDALFLVIQAPLLSTFIWTGTGKDFVTVEVQPTNGNGYNFYLGAGDDRLNGSNFEDRYFDQGGNDIVNLGGGGDWAIAGKGDDTIDGAGGVDSISFTQVFGDGYHPISNDDDVTVATQGVSLNLALTTAQYLGALGYDTFLNFENIYGTEGNDSFHGNAAENLLQGNGGNDYLRGREGDDFLVGGRGADTLIGDAGADDIYTGDNDASEGDGSNDIVKFTHISNSTEESFDTVFNFETFASGGGDKIDLAAIDANLSIVGDQSFAYRGTGSFISSGGEVRLFVFGSSTYVLVDNDADAAAEMVILLNGASGLTANDFIL